MVTYIGQLTDDVKVAQERLDLAREQMGHDLGGFSVVDLLADNFPWPLEWCRKVAGELQ